MCTIVPSRSVHGENRSSVTDEPVEFEKRPVEGQDFRRITHHSRGIYGRCLKSIEENRRCQRENRSSVTDEPVEFEKRLVEVQDLRRITYHSRGIYGRCLNSIQENRKMSTGRTGRQLQMNRWSLRNDRSEFKTSGELPIILEESMEDASNP